MLVKVGVHVYLCVRGEDRLYGLLLIRKKTNVAFCGHVYILQISLEFIHDEGNP